MGTFSLFLRTLIALGLVLGLVWGLAKLSGRAGAGRRLGRRAVPGMADDAQVRVLTRRSLSRTAGVAVVQVGERHLVLGTTPQHVTLLTELQPGAESADELLAPLPGGAECDTPRKATSRQTPMAWDAVISTLRERTIRH